MKQPSGGVSATPDLKHFVAAEAELAHLRQEHGLPQEKHGRLWHLLDRVLLHRQQRQKRLCNKASYLKLCLLGIVGAHRFYEGRWGLGLLYLATCWSGFSVAMTIIDAMVVIPMKGDEQGNVML